ncbi:hypothetical protein [endosymbiont of Lamellibrachia barhami]|uniref:hypothetical protein n=1 Tax=endosymbiont of Lamellibrachia barhami TaxID=205975 RepID=UPI0015B314E8|nr:hypothetical protein [endosymbiont of Lamellibrachia barhami]
MRCQFATSACPASAQAKNKLYVTRKEKQISEEKPVILQVALDDRQRIYWMRLEIEVLYAASKRSFAVERFSAIGIEIAVMP